MITDLVLITFRPYTKWISLISTSSGTEKHTIMLVMTTFQEYTSTLSTKNNLPLCG